MQTWIRADADFGLPYVVFRIPHRILTTIASIAIGDLTLLTDLFIDMIEKARPGLKGGSVLGITFDLAYGGFEVAYTHPSLPRPPMGGMAETWPLESAPTSPVTIPVLIDTQLDRARLDTPPFFPADFNGTYPTSPVVAGRKSESIH
jgi:hypothetical protein